MAWRGVHSRFHSGFPPCPSLGLNPHTDVDRDRAQGRVRTLSLSASLPLGASSASAFFLALLSFVASFPLSVLPTREDPDAGPTITNRSILNY